MDPLDPRHGKVAGYVAGCRDSCCRAAIADWTRHARTRRYLTGGLMVPGLGTHRRIRALMALGWSTTAIDARIGKRRTYTSAILGAGPDAPIRRITADLYRDVYEQMSMILPPEGTRYERQSVSRVRNHARQKGWLPPLAWNDIDDQNERPNVGSKVIRKDSGVDHAVVERLLDGEKVPSTPVEKGEALRRWVAAGRTAKSLEDIHGWKQGRYHRQEAA